MNKINNKLSQGFTLIELLIVIAVLGILSGGILVAIDPADRVNSANDSRVQSDLGIIGRAAEAYAAQTNGNYPAGATVAAAGTVMIGAGVIKSVPAAPSGYVYTYTALPAACTTACTSVTITSPLKSKKYSTTAFWRYESSTGKSCPVAAAATACP